MSILITASFIALVMPDVQCWPNMSNIAALYTNKKLFLNFKELEVAGEIKLLVIVFKNFHYVENVNVTLASGNVIITGNERFAGFEMSEFVNISESSFSCYMHKLCFFGSLDFTNKDNKFKLMDIVIDGYETKLHKYVGCFDKKHFKTLKPVAQFLDCESTCSDTPFYGFTLGEQCVCIESLPLVNGRQDLCGACPRKEAIFCGINGNGVSVYSKGSVQEVLNMDPNIFAAYIAMRGRYPGCIDGRRGIMCIAIDCSKNNGNCGNKKCVILNHAKSEVHLCFCAEGLYTDDALECQDIDECIKDQVCKHRKRTCVNKYGGYTCECGSGLYEVDEINCTDIDECKTETGCDLKTTTCKNLYGDYNCVCLEGLVKLDPTSRNSSCGEPKTPVDSVMISLIILAVLCVIVIFICFLLRLFRKGK